MKSQYYPWQGQDPIVKDVLASQNGETDAELSRRTGITTQTIRRWRQKKTKRPNISTIRTFLRANGCDLRVTRVNRLET